MAYIYIRSLFIYNEQSDSKRTMPLNIKDCYIYYDAKNRYINSIKIYITIFLILYKSGGLSIDWSSDLLIYSNSIYI